MSTVQFGLDTFGDVTVDAEGGRVPYAQVIRDLVEQAVLADRVGVDVIGVGEHHRDDFAVSAPEVVLAAIAGKTERIHLGTAVTVLSSDDPVRVFERFATLDAVSGGRAEVILGRGSFTESFPLFGFDLADYERLFTEKLDLMGALLTEKAVTWEGTVRAPLTDQHVYPKTESGLRAWIGVGGSPESVVRAARYGLPLVLAIIGGQPARFAPFVELYHRALKELGRPVGLPVAVHCPGFVAETDEEAADVVWPHVERMFNRIGAERGWSPMTRDRFEADVAEGAWHVGSPETVARKIADTVGTLGIQRFSLKYATGTTPHKHLMSAVELYGTEVVPRVRELLAERQPLT